MTDYEVVMCTACIGDIDCSTLSANGSCLISVELKLMICCVVVSQLTSGRGLGLSGLLDLLLSSISPCSVGLPGGGVLGGVLFDFRTITLDQSVVLNPIPISSRVCPIR